METVDYDQNGTINYSEFIMGTLEPSIHLSENNLNALFSYLDPYNRGYLTVKSLLISLSKVGKHFSEEEIEDMFDEAGLDPSIPIDYETFKALMRGELSSTFGTNSPFKDETPKTSTALFSLEIKNTPLSGTKNSSERVEELTPNGNI